MITRPDFGLANGLEMYHQYFLEGEKNPRKSLIRVGKTTRTILWYPDLVPDTLVTVSILREAKVAEMLGGLEMGKAVLLSPRLLTSLTVEGVIAMLMVVTISSLVSHLPPPHPGRILFPHRNSRRTTW
jgi:hypothetical protein